MQDSPVTASNVTVTYRLSVKPGGAITTQTNTDPVVFDALTCAAGTVNEARYIEVAIADKYTPMFPIHFANFNADGTYHVSAKAGMRTQ